jgi:hypothetical protein
MKKKKRAEEPAAPRKRQSNLSLRVVVRASSDKLLHAGRHGLYHGSLEGNGAHIPLGTVLASSSDAATKKLRALVLSALRKRG